jgi:hypothetical protein
MNAHFRVRSFPPIRQKEGEWMGHGAEPELNGRRPSDGTQSDSTGEYFQGSLTFRKFGQEIAPFCAFLSLN